MIDPTDEMADAFRRAEVAYWEAREATAEGMTVAEHGRAAYRAGLAAAFELVERDYPATEYTLSPLPEEDINGSSFQIIVAYRGRGLWAVSRHRHCLGRSGEWDWESLPSSRTDEWLAEHRFPLDEALRLAREELPKLRVNGKTAAEVAAWAAEQREARP